MSFFQCPESFYLTIYRIDLVDMMLIIWHGHVLVSCIFVFHSSFLASTSSNKSDDLLSETPTSQTDSRTSRTSHSSETTISTVFLFLPDLPDTLPDT